MPERPEETDAEIAEHVRALRADRPDLDWDNLLMGRLAGPVSDDRPEFPIWEYPEAMRVNPDLRLADLTAARFPVRFFEGGWTVTSIDEELKPVPKSHTGPALKPRFPLDAMSIIRKYQAQHDADLIEWDPTTRGLNRLRPVREYRDVYRTWADSEIRRFEQ